MSRPSQLIRADGGSRLGMGHVTRCLGLAQAAALQGVGSTFACTAGDRVAIDAIEAAGFAALPLDTVDSARTLSAAIERTRPTWIVIDHPALDIEFEQALATLIDAPLAVIDGTFRRHRCDLLINPNVFATRSSCRTTVDPTTGILAGYDFFLLRESYLHPCPPVDSGIDHALRPPARAPRLLVTLGGSDPGNLTRSICADLLETGLDRLGAHVDLVIGPGNEDGRRIERLLEQGNGDWIRIHRAPPDLFELLSRCTVCLSAGGITIGEAAYVGRPVVGMVAAENQRRTIEFLARAGDLMAVTVDRAVACCAELLRDEPRRRRLEDGLGARVDGQGARRVAGHLLSELSGLPNAA